MFQTRQLEDVFQQVEISTATISPGAVANGAANAVYVAAAFTTPGGVAASFNAGDYLIVIPPLGAAVNGVSIDATGTATAGTAGVAFTNVTGGSITPASGKYTIIAIRITPTLS
jgi:hypothetical protein